jgi:hypothetical protein
VGEVPEISICFPLKFSVESLVECAQGELGWLLESRNGGQSGIDLLEFGQLYEILEFQYSLSGTPC